MISPNLLFKHISYVFSTNASTKLVIVYRTMKTIHVASLTLTFISMLLLVYGKRQYLMEGTRYALRIYNVSMCDAPQRKVFLGNITIQTYNQQQYLFCDVHVPEDIQIKKMKVNIYRCISDGFVCENFQTWDFPEICSFAMMKNQIWSPVVDTTFPKFSCPNVKKNLYKMVNTTIDLNKVVQLYPDVVNYHWKGDAMTYDNKGNIIHCSHVEGYLLPYTKRTKA